MAWFLPIGVFEGVKLTSEIQDSIADLSGDGEVTHAVLRLGSGSAPVDPEYSDLLEFLSTAPSQELLNQWAIEQEDPDQAATKFAELVEDGVVMSFGEFPVADDRMQGRLVKKIADIERVPFTPTAGHETSLVYFGGGSGRAFANAALLDVVDTMGRDATTSLQQLSARFNQAVGDEEAARSEAIFASGLQSLVQAGVVEIYLQE